MIAGAWKRVLRAKELRFPLNVLFGFHEEWMRMQNLNTATLKACTKPPNIVILSRKPGNTNLWKSLLERVLAKNCYVIYEIERKDFTKTYWPDNVSLFVLDYVFDLKESEKHYLEKFIENGGNAFLHCSSYSIRDESAVDAETCLQDEECLFQDGNKSHSFTGKVHSSRQKIDEISKMETLCCTLQDNYPTIFSDEDGSGQMVVSALDFLSSISSQETTNPGHGSIMILSLLKLILRKLNLKCTAEECSNSVGTTPGFLFGQPEDLKVFSAGIKSMLASETKSNDNFEFIESTDALQAVNQETFPIISCNKDEMKTKLQQYFNFQDYLKRLRASKLGRIVIFSQTVTSTQQILEKMYASLSSLCDGLLIVAAQQLQGKGRGGNKWLSPAGCMMFSLALGVNLSSELGRRLPYLQHIAAVAVVHSIREQPGYENLQLRIKWPNDIYFGSNIKIGGLIVNSSYSSGQFKAIIGLGLNVSNDKPTICLNSIIDQYNLENCTNLKYLRIEKILACTMVNLEKILHRFEAGGYKEFCELYYKYWLHGEQEIRLGDEDGEKVTIKGLDNSGFLLVQRISGNQISVQPDGNSFDMMKGLIYVKTKY